MSKIVVAGGGVCGLGTAMMLGRRGHDVTVLERNAEEPPDTFEKAWDAWERPGVGQFRMGHYFMARWHQIVKAELPDLLPKLDAAGALRLNPVLDAMPPDITDRARRDDDDQFDVITGRRPVFEWVIARAAAGEPNVEIRRGVSVSGLVTGASAIDGVPHVTGIVTDRGETLTADLVLDAGGRRSALAQWLQAAGAPPFHEESEDSGFRYYGRYYRAKGAWPTNAVPTLAILGSVALIALPADNDTWMIGVITAAKDKALYKLTDVDAWTRVVAATPSIAPFLDGEPITPLETMMAIPDRYRRFVVDGQPVATGLTAIGDAWAATNPMRGRGVTMGFLQSQIVVNHITESLGDPAAFALAIDAQVEGEVAPYYHGTVELDRGMRDAFERDANGEEPAAHDPDDPIAAMQAKFFSLIPFDADAWRGMVKIVNLLDQPINVVASEPLLSKVLAYDGEIFDPLAGEGPSRQELVDIAASANSVAGPLHRWDDLVEAG